MNKYSSIIISIITFFLISVSCNSPSNEFNVKIYGATGDGKTMDTEAINKTINACSNAGGGKVLFPSGGTYLTGSIHLKSNIVYEIEKGATVLGAPNGINAYDHPEPNEWDKYQDFGHSHYHNSLMWGENVENISFTGGGEINGGGIARSTVPAGDGNKAIAIKGGNNIYFQNIKINQGGWFAIILNNCRNINIDSVIVHTNRDGIDLMSCSDVAIRNSEIHSDRYENGEIKGGDDAIGIKSDYALGRKINSENIIIENCVVSSGGANGIQFGSETVGNFKNITVKNVTIERANKAGIGITSNDGAVIEDVAYINIRMSKVQTPFFILISDQGRSPENPKPGKIKNILFEDIVAEDCYGYEKKRVSTATISGLPGYTVDNVVFKNVSITYKGGGSKEDAQIKPPYMRKTDSGVSYSPRGMGKRPASGFYIRHARDIKFENLKIHFEKSDYRPIFVLNDVKEIEIIDPDIQTFKETGTDIIARSVSGLKVSPVHSLRIVNE